MFHKSIGSPLTTKGVLDEHRILVEKLSNEAFEKNYTDEVFNKN